MATAKKEKPVEEVKEIEGTAAIAEPEGEMVVEPIEEEAPALEPEVVLTPEEKKDTTSIATTIVSAKTAEEAVAQFTPAQVALIKRLIAKDATNDELHMFIAVCKSAGLNPFLKQIYFVKRYDSKLEREVGAVQVGIDGFRSIAEGTGAYAGNADPIFEGEVESEWKNRAGKVMGKFKHPEKATVTVRKVVQGVAYDFTASARWDEFYPGDAQGFMWRSKPHVMLGKCAEGQALRKAFPKQLSGLYTPEEMDQAGSVVKALPADDYSRTRAIIKRSTNADGLEAMTVAIKTSKKYTEDQKETILLELHDRVAELRGDGKDATPEEENTVA